MTMIFKSNMNNNIRTQMNLRISTRICTCGIDVDVNTRIAIIIIMPILALIFEILMLSHGYS